MRTIKRFYIAGKWATSDDGVFIPFSNNLFLAPSLRGITFYKYVVFPDLNLPKVGPQDVRFFNCFSSCGADTV